MRESSRLQDDTDSRQVGVSQSIRPAEIKIHIPTSNNNTYMNPCTEY